MRWKRRSWNGRAGKKGKKRVKKILRAKGSQRDKKKR